MVGMMASGEGTGRPRPGLTVGSLLGLPLGSLPEPAARSFTTGEGPAIVAEEGPWTIAGGNLTLGRSQPAFRADGVEALSYDNPFGQAVEQVWFDGKRVYAVDLGEVEVDAQRVKVAQEYQLVYAVDLDDQGKLRGEPETVPGQLNIYDSVPGMAQYSPIWQFNYVVVPRDYRPNTLRSEQDCRNSGYPIRRSRVFEN